MTAGVKAVQPQELSGDTLQSRAGWVWVAGTFECHEAD